MVDTFAEQALAGANAIKHGQHVWGDPYTVMLLSGPVQEVRCTLCPFVESYRYSGIDRKGAHVTGQLRASVDQMGAFVERHWRNGWQELHVTIGAEAVGGIEPTPWGSSTRARRTWWAEGPGL